MNRRNFMQAVVGAVTASLTLSQNRVSQGKSSAKTSVGAPGDLVVQADGPIRAGDAVVWGPSGRVRTLTFANVHIFERPDQM